MIPSNHQVLMQGYALATGENIGYKIGQIRFYFVLTDSLSYYETEESFTSGSIPIGIILLEEFSISKNDSRGKFQLAVHA